MKKEWERLEPMRIRIMSEAYDLADRGDSEGFNSVKVMCSDVLALIETEIATEREKVAQWMIERGFATGHGDSIEDLLKELEWQVAERERTAVIETIDELMGMESDRHPMFSEGYDHALDHIKQFVQGRGKK
jgi:hypothetical protein